MDDFVEDEVVGKRSEMRGRGGRREGMTRAEGSYNHQRMCFRSPFLRYLYLQYIEDVPPFSSLGEEEERLIPREEEEREQQ